MALSMLNSDNSILVIASYPPKDAIHHPLIVGGASYTKNTLLALQRVLNDKSIDSRIIVLAEKLTANRHSEPNEKSEDNNSYEDNGINVKRVWQRNNFSSFFSLINEINKYKKTEKILFSLELAMFGGQLSLLGIMLLLIWLKISGKKTYIVLHQVIANLQDMEGHLGKTSPTLMTHINNFALRQFYRLVIFASYKIIVFEQTFKDYLHTLGDSQKVVVIPHGVEKFVNSVTKKQARENLHIDPKKKVIMLFGFLAWYKGTDWIVNQIDKQSIQKNNIQIIIAGGPNPNRLELDFYQKYLKDLEQTAKEKNILITGFVPENKIGLYFQSADVVLFPYRALMSSSGPFSIALAFGTALLLADKLLPLTKTVDFKTTLTDTKIAEKELFFPLNQQGLDRIISQINDQTFLDKSHKFALTLAQKRAWSAIEHMYYETIFTN